MSKKIIVILISLIIAIVVFIKSLPYLGILAFMGTVSISGFQEEQETKSQVEDYLEEKYNREFNVVVNSNFELGTDISASTIGKPSYSFRVDKNKDYKSGAVSYADYLLENVVNHHIKEVQKKYPAIENRELIQIKARYSRVDARKATFDYESAFPTIENIPIKPMIDIKIIQLREGDINREEALATLQDILAFFQKEGIPIKELKTIVSVKGTGTYTAFQYDIPVSSISKLTTVEELKKYEKRVY
jgi:hypothetical protein